MDGHSQNEQIGIRNCRNEKDLENLLKLAEKEGWCCDLENLKIIRDIFGAEGWWVLEQNERFVGTAFNIKLNRDCATFSAFVISEEFRGRGFGRKALKESLKWLKDYNVFAGSAPQMVKTYEKYGFKADLVDSIYGGTVNTSNLVHQPTANLVNDHLNIVDIRLVDLRKILDFDREHNIRSLPWSNYLGWHLLNENSQGYAILDEDKVLAIGARNTLANQPFIGPIYAKDPKHGEYLLQRHLEEIGDGSLCQIVLPKDNIRGNEIIQSAGLIELSTATRIFTKHAYRMPVNSYFAYTIAGSLGITLF